VSHSAEHSTTGFSRRAQLHAVKLAIFFVFQFESFSKNSEGVGDA
jgi:hypothetical protein